MTFCCQFYGNFILCFLVSLHQNLGETKFGINKKRKDGITMKKQKIIAIALGTVIGLGSIFGGGAVYADEINKQDTSNEYTMEVCEKTFEDELLENSILSKEELKIYNEAIDKIFKLYEGLEEVDLNDEVLDKLEKEENKIYEENKILFDKVDKYFETLEDAPHNKKANEMEEEVNPELMQEEFYNELLENNVLDSGELDLLKEAEEKLDILYGTNLEDIDEDEFFKREDAIYKHYKDIFDKINTYFDNMIEDVYKEMISSGDLTEEQIEALKEADKKVDELLDTLDDNASEEKIDEIFNEIDKLYEGLDF